jgi:nicotinamide phosphoribosyltransferase
MQNAQGDWTKVGEFEYEMFVYLLKKFPSGILSLVMDTFDLWRAITEYCVKAKDLIMSRDGKLVIRPDSGDPVDILCGTRTNPDIIHTMEGRKSVDAPSEYGVIELLWDIFGGTVSSTGYKVLDSHIGAIYGDSINYDRAQRIFERLADKGFASTNVVLGIGSYSLQHVTRDTHGSAQKATYIEILQQVDKHGIMTPVGIEIFKDPITDGGVKKSAKGLLQVYEEDGVIKLKDQCTWEEEGKGLLQVIFEDGKFYNETTLTRIREKLNN